MIKILNEEKGSGLILILIVMMLMTVLGTTALYSMGTEGKQATLHNYKTQAYYLARSGVEIGQQWLKNKEFNIAGVVYLSGDLGGNFVEASDSSKAVNITITESGNIYTIKATGQHNGQKEVVSLEIKNTSESSFPTGNNALYVSNSITFSGSTRILGSVATDFNSPTQIAFNSSGGQYISGDVYILNPSISKSQINYGFKIHGQVKTSDEPLTFSMPNFPVFPNLPIHPNMVEGTHNVIAEGNLNITNYQVANFTLHLNSDYKFNQINMNSGRTLNINIGNQDRVIVVEQLNIENGFINILGTGKLTIYVNNNITFNNGRINSEDKTQNLTIYLKGSGNPSHPKVVNISGSQKIYASLYAEDADVQLFNSGGFQGNIITGGKNVNLSGSATANVRAIYAPNAKVSVDAGANIKGVVISNEFSMSGNTTLEYTDVKGDPFLESLFGGNVSYKPIWK